MRDGRWRKDLPNSGKAEVGAKFPAYTSWFSSNEDFQGIAAGLREVGFSEDDVKGITAENWILFLRQRLGTWKARTPPTPISIDIPAGGGLRPPEQVMRLERMGASFPTRLSFMRSVMRALSRETAAVERTCWRMDDEGFGHAIYEVALGGYRYSLVAFSTRLDPDKRTDRVIAEAWDTSYVLFDGVPDDGDIARLEANAPLQEAGRFEECDLILSRANKSVRLFEHVADCLAKGVQPDLEQIRSIGYLMRTTAVYGNGKFGIADRTAIASRPGLDGPFRAEMLLVWLIRGFTHDLVEHVARRRSPETF